MTLPRYLLLSFGFSRSKDQVSHNKHNQNNVKANEGVERVIPRKHGNKLCGFDGGGTLALE